MNLLRNLEVIEKDYKLKLYKDNDQIKVRLNDSKLQRSPQKKTPVHLNQLEEILVVPEVQLVLPKWIEISDDILRHFQKLVKQVNRDKRRVSLVFANNQNDEAGLAGDELSCLLQGILARFKIIESLNLNIEHWGLLFMVLPNIEDALKQIGSKDLLELTIHSTNISLNPSITNTTVKSLGAILESMVHLTYLELILDDPSSEKKKQINEDGFIAFCEGLGKLTKLRTLKLQLGCWFSFFRQHIKDASNCIKKFSNALSNKCFLRSLSLNLKWWEDIEFQQLALICNSLSASIAHQLEECSLNFQRWSYFNNQKQDLAVKALGELLGNLKNCKSLHLSFFNLGTGFQDQRDSRKQINAGGSYLCDDSEKQNIQANPDLLKLFMSQINQMRNLQDLQIQIHEYVSWNGMKILRNSIIDLALLTKLKITSQSEKYESVKYLSTLVQLPKLKRNIIYFLNQYKKTPYNQKFRKDLPCHIVEMLFKISE